MLLNLMHIKEHFVKTKYQNWKNSVVSEFLILQVKTELDSVIKVSYVVAHLTETNKQTNK